MHLFLQKVGFANQINNKNFNNKTNSFAESETDISFTFCLALIRWVCSYTNKVMNWWIGAHRYIFHWPIRWWLDYSKHQLIIPTKCNKCHKHEQQWQFTDSISSTNIDVAEDVTEVIVEEDVTQKDVTKIKANKIYFCNQELTASCAKSR